LFKKWEKNFNSEKQFDAPKTVRKSGRFETDEDLKNRQKFRDFFCYFFKSFRVEKLVFENLLEEDGTFLYPI
jgi:hypothetical protein